MEVHDRSATFANVDLSIRGWAGVNATPPWTQRNPWTLFLQPGYPGEPIVNRPTQTCQGGIRPESIDVIVAKILPSL